MKFNIKKGDIILFIILLLITLTATIFLLYPKSKPSVKVVIKVDGKEYGKYTLTTNQDLEIITEYGYNNVKIYNGEVWIETSDCKNQLCLFFGKINKPGMVIVCLPHRLSITIESNSITNEEIVPDAVIY